MKAAVPTILLSIIFNSLDSNNHVLRKSHSEINVHNIHPLCALRTDANKSHLSIPYNEVLAQSTKSPSCTPRRRGTVEKPPGFATFSASSTSANGATVTKTWIQDFGRFQDFSFPKSWVQDFGRFQDFSFPKSWIQYLRRCQDFRVLGIPISKTLVIRASPVTLTLSQIAKVIWEGEALITRVLGIGMPKTRGYPYHTL